MTLLTPPVIVASFPESALKDGLYWLKVAGELNDSRNGRVLVSPTPVLTVYPHPAQRVLIDPLRDANPFFHLFESLWMLAGRNDVAKVAVYAKQMEAFADDGLQWGAYGFRWRHFFGFDQLAQIIDMLRRDPKTRRAVLTMWTPNGDLINAEGGAGGPSAKDVPCNTQVYFDATRGRLDMTVTNRSNDIVWGAYGANLVHMSMMLEFMAGAVGLPMGTYYQFSNNFHAYVDRPDVQRLISPHSTGGGRPQWNVHVGGTGQYTLHKPYPLFEGGMGDEWEAWLRDCEQFVEDPLGPDGLGRSYRHGFFPFVAQPMLQAHHAYKLGDWRGALMRASLIQAEDWRCAATEWLVRRQESARRLMEGRA